MIFAGRPGKLSFAPTPLARRPITVRSNGDRGQQATAKQPPLHAYVLPGLHQEPDNDKGSAARLLRAWAEYSSHGPMLLVTGQRARACAKFIAAAHDKGEQLFGAPFVSVLSDWSIRCDDPSSIRYLADVIRRTGAATVVFDLAHSGGCLIGYAINYAKLLRETVDVVVEIDASGPGEVR